MICEVGRLGVACGNDAAVAIDAICDHEHMETDVPTCAYCLAEMQARDNGLCGVCNKAGYPGTHMAIIATRPLGSP